MFVKVFDVFQLRKVVSHSKTPLAAKFYLGVTGILFSDLFFVRAAVSFLKSLARQMHWVGKPASKSIEAAFDCNSFEYRKERASHQSSEQITKF